jgi:hypothetical protein
MSRGSTIRSLEQIRRERDERTLGERPFHETPRRLESLTMLAPEMEQGLQIAERLSSGSLRSKANDPR